jgi:YXWGXW repeat-containing protein
MLVEGERMLKAHTLRATLLGGLVALTLTGCLVAEPTAPPVVAAAPPPPPPVQAEVVPLAPGPAYVWIPGHWGWRPRGYVWVPGFYALPAQPGYVWVPAHWAARRGGWAWVQGHWRPR